MHYLKTLMLSVVLAGVAFAGPALSCRTWVVTPGSTFEALEPLRSIAMEADDGPAQMATARKRIADLRAAMRPADALSILKAGYWIAVMNAIGITKESDGPELIRKAMQLRPNDAEYQFFTALAYFEGGEKALYNKHWAKAQELAAKGSAVARNLKIYEKELSARTQ